jgi:hypothetical protein
MIEPNNDILNFEINNFEIQPFSKQKITLKCVARKIGTFRLLALFYKVFNIPRFYVIDENFDCSEHFKIYMYNNVNKAISEQYQKKRCEAQRQDQKQINPSNLPRENQTNEHLNRVGEVRIKNYFKPKQKQNYEFSTLNCELNRFLRE